jgi:cobalt-zinc-cadmium efflux system outer membrane protein
MNQRVAIFVAALAIPTIVSSTVAPAAAQTGPGVLDQRRYVEEVLRAGLESRVADAEAALGRVERVGAGAWPNPALAWQRESVGSGPASGSTQDILSVSVPLVLSGRLGLEREAAFRGAEAAAARRSRARAELRHEAVHRFHTALAAGEKKTVLADSLGKLRQLADVIATREKAGDASGYDRLRITLEAAAIDDLVRGAVLAERAARAAALALLSPDHASLPALQGSLAAAARMPSRPPRLEEMEGRADLRALTLEAGAAESARQAAGRSWIPELELTAGAQVLNAGRLGESRGYVAGVQLPLPLFQRRQGEGARAQARRDLAEARRATLLREARATLAALTVASDERRKRFELHRAEVVARAEELRKIATAAYRGGASDLLALVDAERAAREASLQAIDLAMEVVEAENDLSLLAGVHDEPDTRRQKP